MAGRADGLNDIFDHNIEVKERLTTKEGTIHTTPTENLDIVNKKYVDDNSSIIDLVATNPTSEEDGTIILNTTDKIVYIWHLNTWRVLVTPTYDKLLLETGDIMLLETGDKIIR